MPPISQSFTQSTPHNNWTFREGSIYDFVAVNYPLFTNEFIVTKRLDKDSDFGDTALVMSEKGLSGLLKHIDAAKKGDLATEGTCVQDLWRAFRIESDPEDDTITPENTYWAVDGDYFHGNKVQGIMMPNVVRQTS